MDEMPDGEVEFDPLDTYFTVFRDDTGQIFAVVVPKPVWDQFKRCSDQHTPYDPSWANWDNAAEALLEWQGNESATLEDARDDLLRIGLELKTEIDTGNPADGFEYIKG